MNYKFLSLLVLVVCMQTKANADVAALSESVNKGVTGLKIGYVDMQYIIETLPEAKKCEMDLKSFHKQIDSQFQSKCKELQESAESFQKEKDKLTQAQQNQKYAEINKLQEACQELQMSASHKMAQKYTEIMGPLHERIQAAVRKLAEEGAYTFVFSKKNQGTGELFLLFAQESLDLSNLLLERLKKEVPPVVAKLPVVGPQKNTATASKAAQGKKK